MDILTGEILSPIQLANIDLIYWSASSSSGRREDGVKGVCYLPSWEYHFIMSTWKIWVNIQVILYRLKVYSFLTRIICTFVVSAVCVWVCVCAGFNACKFCTVHISIYHSQAKYVSLFFWRIFKEFWRIFEEFWQTFEGFDIDRAIKTGKFVFSVQFSSKG